MPAPNVVGIVQVFNELSEHPDYLPRVFASFRRVCHTVIAFDDGSTDGTTDWLAREADELVRHRKNDWKREIEHKAAMLTLAARHRPEWILWLDADEELSPGAVSGIVEQSERWKADRVTGVRILETNLWRDRLHHRVDRLFDRGWFMRLWRWHPGLHYSEPRPGLHQTQFPPGVDQQEHRMDPARARVIHYSWDSREKIAAKYARYAALGQHGEDLERIKDDPEACVVPVDPGWMWPAA